MPEGYQTALKILEEKAVAESTFLDTDEAWAIEKSMQAIRDCLEIGLNGIGD